MNEIIDKALAGDKLTLPEIETIYGLDADSPEAYLVRWAGNLRAKELSGGKAEIHAQIGLDAGPCVKSCQFWFLVNPSGIR